jgi:hypothetical protein
MRAAIAEGEDDFDVIGPDGLVIGRIFKATRNALDVDDCF